MSRIKYAIDSPVTRHWAERVGQLIINFSSLEFETYMWLVQMSEQPERIPDFAKQKFAQRVTLINRYIEDHGYTAKWKTESLVAWTEALELAKLRNRIAHNPLTFAWTNKAERGEPDYIGVTEMQGLDPPKDGPLLSKASIERSINQIIVLIKRLELLRQEWCGCRDTLRAQA